MTINENSSLKDLLASGPKERFATMNTYVDRTTCTFEANPRRQSAIDKDALILAVLHTMGLESAKLLARQALATSDKDMRRKIDYAIKERISARNWQPRVHSAKEDKLMNGSFRRNQPHTASRFRVNRFQ